MSHASESSAVTVFVALVLAVFALAVRALHGRFLASPRRPLRAWSRVILGVAALGVMCILYARLVEPYWLETTHTRVETERLPPGHPGVRVVLLSDIHSDPRPRLEERLPAVVASLHPDLIVFTGDALNAPRGLALFRRVLTTIAKLAPTFAVKGNWDIRMHPELDRFGGTGATELDGFVATIGVGGVPVRVAGAGFDHPERLADALRALPADGPALALYHCPYPDLVPPTLAHRVDLFCAGHVHGGQLALPVHGALITLSRFGKRFERGLYPKADGFGFPMYVSRGIGMEGGLAPRVRFWSRPEVALIELVPRDRGR